MRELKFRAWDYIDGDPLSPYPMDWDELLSMQMDRVFDDKLIVEQFTGLYDKNGTEIYEGDILVVRRVTDWNGDYWKQPAGPAIPTLVEWDQKLARFRMPLTPSDFEIIGNIHENPELLEATR